MAGISYTTRSVPYASISLTGGLNTTAGPLSTADNESSSLQNIDFNKFGSILKRAGYVNVNSTAISSASVSSIHWYEFDSAGTKTRYALMSCDDKLYKMDLNGSGFPDGTADDITGAYTITADAQCRFVNFYNNVYGVNSSDAPFYWSGTSTITAAGIPTGLTNAKYIAEFNNYLFYANCTVSGTLHGSRVYFSDFKDPATWDAANYIEVGLNDGTDITGIKVLSDRMVIFKERSIYNMFFTGDADIPFTLPGGGKSNSSVGCIAPNSIQEVQNGIVFFSYDGFYFYDGINSYKISDKVTSTIDNFIKTNFQYMVSLNQQSKNRYMATFRSTDSTESDTVLVWDYVNNAWSVYKGMAPYSMGIFYINGVQEVPYFGDYDGFIYRMDYGTNDHPLGVETAIDSYYYTNWKYFGDLVHKKGVPYLLVYYQTGSTTLTVAYSYDFESADVYSNTISLSYGASVYDTALWDTATYAGSGGGVKRIDLTGRGRVIRIKFANAQKGETFQIDGIGLLPYLETVAG